MKKSLLVFTTLTVTSTINFAVQAQPGPGAFPRGGPGGANFERQDFGQKMLQRFDTNHDGVLDDNERAQMREMMQKRRMQGQNEGFGGPDDLGHSGANARDGHQPGSFGQGGGPGALNGTPEQVHKQKMLQKFDANHDGQLDDAERAQMKEMMQRRRAEREGKGFGGNPPAAEHN